MLRAKLDRVAVVVKDIDKAMNDMGIMLGCDFYGPLYDQGPGLAVALPKRGGLELVSPTSQDDSIGATQFLGTNGEGIKGMAFRVEDIEEAERHFASLGLKPDVKIIHGGMKEILFSAQEATHGIEIAINEYPEANGMGIEVARDLGADI